MPADVTLDLTGLWHRETELKGAYTYGTETLPDGRTCRTFDLAIETANDLEAERLLSATYPLVDHVDAIAHAATAGRRGAVKIAFDLRKKLMPRPGFVLDVDRSTPPTLFWHGEGFRLEKLPADRSRVVYAPEPEAAIDDIDGAIRNALLNPIEMDPLPTLLFPGMKLTIAFDDVSLPLPKMQRPDLRQRIIEQVLTMAADAGVDDVHIIAALALHRRMHEFELRHALGDRVYDAFEPRGQLYQHDAEDPEAARVPRHHAVGRGDRDQQAGRRIRPARLRQHQPRRDGRRLEVDRHRARVVPVAAPPPQPHDDGGVALVHGPAPLRAAQEQLADGQGHARPRSEDLPDRDDAQHRSVPEAVRLPVEARVGVERQGPRDRTSPRPSRWPGRRRGSPARSSTASRRRTR